MNINSPSKESIAIIGMSCRFPHASTLEEFWQLLKNGKDTISEIPKERWDMEAYFDADPSVEQKTNQRHASLLKGIHDFDPLFFNISPAEASEMSPSQKLMLELAWEAFENSTVPYNDVKGHAIGVYVGTIWADYEHYRKSRNALTTSHSAVGMSANVIANRVSYVMGLTGPSMAIDTGCSASLVALHLACQSLLHHETEMSVVGGINHLLEPEKYIQLTKFGGLSASGKCSTFDNEADGFVRGEGGAVLVLKRLSEAERDGNKIYAVIRGTAVNNNGFNETLPATSTEGQRSLLEKVYREAGILPADVHYIEAHGTGTRLGDPNEARALGEFFKVGRTDTPLRVGSVKTNIGHTEATAGIAGLVKVVLAMQYGTLPPNLNFHTPNTNIAFDDLKLEVQKELSRWPADRGETFKAGVNSFGWGGTNAHAVVEEYRGDKQSILQAKHIETTATRYCLPLSAKSSAALKDYAKAYLQKLEHADAATAFDICVATSLLKPEFDHRYLFTGSDHLQLMESIRDFIADETEVVPCHVSNENAKIVFVFPGQGGQWLGMGRTLLAQEKIFREVIEACDKAFSPYTDWSLIEQLTASAETSRLNEINVIQPAICAIQIALARVWMSWGITPHAVVGHSMGEVAAAYLSGALSLEDAARVICSRSLLMKTVSGKGGAMAVTELSRAEAEKIAAHYPDKLSVAVNNSPKSTVLAGDKESIDQVIADLNGKGLFCRLVKVDVASHSPQMDPLKESLRNQLQNVVPQETVIPFFSTVKSQVMKGQDMGADYWVNNLRGMVQFASVMEKLLAEKHTVFIEVNPHPVLVNAVNECADFDHKSVTTLSSLYREKPERKELDRNLAEFYTKGYSIPWATFFGTRIIPKVSLPLYPFQRESFEVEDRSHEVKESKEAEAAFPLLGNPINLASASDTYYWNSSISLKKFPYLRDHVIHHQVELPISCYIEIILEAMTALFNAEASFRMEGMEISRYLVLSEKSVDIQVKLIWTESQTGEVALFVKESTRWEVLAKGMLVGSANEDKVAREVFEKIEYHAPAYTEGGSYYHLLKSIGQQYGKHFQQLTGLDRFGSSAFSNVLFSMQPDTYSQLTAEKYKIHPALMNSFFQPIFIQLTTLLEEGNGLEVRFSKIGELVQRGAVNYHRELRGLLSFQSLKKDKNHHHTWIFSADITIANFDNEEVMHIKGLEGTALSRPHSKLNEGLKKETSAFSDIHSAASWENTEMVEQMIIHHLAKVVKTAPQRIKRNMTFKSLGVDSLMAVQLRNALEKSIDLKISVSWFWAHPTVREYAIFIWNKLMQENSGDVTTSSGTAELERQIARSETKLNDSPDWMVINHRRPKAKTSVFCFHDAGGSTSLFDDLSNQLDPSFELIAIELPGRNRSQEYPFYQDYQQIVKDVLPQLLPLLNRPYIIAGHSMGAILAFEVVHALTKLKKRLPDCLYVSSAPAPSVYNGREIPYDLDEQQLTGIFPHIDGERIGDSEVQQLLTIRLRADIRVLNSYHYMHQEKLTVPVIALHGKEDLRILETGVAKWKEETTGEFQFFSRPGGHGFIEHDTVFLIKLIQENQVSGKQLAERVTLL